MKFIMQKVLNNYFAKAVYAVVESVIFEIGPNYDEGAVNEAAKFVLSVHSSMQPLYRFGLVILMAVFYFYARARTGRSFSRLSADRRALIMRLWLNSPIGVARDFIRFFLTMTIMFYYDSDNALSELCIDAKAHRKIQ